MPSQEPEIRLEDLPQAVEAKPIETKPEAQKPEPKKGILSSIWPFGKKEEKKSEEKAPAPPISPQKPVEIPIPQAAAEKKPVQVPKSEIPVSIKSVSAPQPAPAPKPEPELQVQMPDTALEDEDLARLEKKALSDEEREMKVKVGIGKSMLGFLAPQVTIEENDVRDLLDELELALLESDVAIEVSTEVTQRLRTTLVGMKVDKGKMQEEVARQMKKVLSDVMTSANSFDFLERVQQKPKPVKILFVGPNGAGKTTTMAKIAHKLMQAKLSVVFAAGDTFRAAAIEQTEVHAQRLGVPVVKSKYGSDPASVAFDAVNYAKAHQTDVVLIDSAGRQDTNANLLDELKKINRVVSPDLKIYIGESIGGHALMEQVRAFHEAIGIDGAILTKLDCDAKGGTALSLTHATGVPILFLGIGQGYDDLEAFDADKVAGQILT
ncbi:Signal recognition particle receptor FtsY [uncultured archaeon]|nr:Signal recognition particle receptor FtsY [uncultured archaeon]